MEDKKTSPSLPEFNELKHKVMSLIYETSDLLFKCEDAVNAEFGLSQQQFMVLLTIEVLSNPLVKISDVARRLKRNPNSISMIIDRMEKGGLVERVRDLQDRRSVHLLLTEKGKEKLHKSSKVSWSLIARLTSCFSEEEMETITRLIEKLREKAFVELNPESPVEDMEQPDMKTVNKLLNDA